MHHYSAIGDDMAEMLQSVRTGAGRFRGCAASPDALAPCARALFGMHAYTRRRLMSANYTSPSNYGLRFLWFGRQHNPARVYLWDALAPVPYKSQWFVGISFTRCDSRRMPPPLAVARPTVLAAFRLSVLPALPLPSVASVAVVRIWLSLSGVSLLLRFTLVAPTCMHVQTHEHAAMMPTSGRASVRYCHVHG